MTSIQALAPDRYQGSSLSPIDPRSAPSMALARFLGWFSVGLGLAETLAPRAMARLTGVGHPTLIQAYGLRELACGVGILTSDRPACWLWARVAGDAMDLATLGAALGEANGSRDRVVASAVAVAGVTGLDILCAEQFSAASAG